MKHLNEDGRNGNIPYAIFAGDIQTYDSLYLGLDFGNYGGWCGEIKARHIAKLNKLTNLDREAKGLEGEPTGIGHLINLTFINLSSNEITYLPKSIGNLKKLRT